MEQISPGFVSGEDDEGLVESVSKEIDSEFHVFTWLTTDGLGLPAGASASDAKAPNLLDLLNTYIIERFDDLVRDAYLACDFSIIEHVDDLREPLNAADGKPQRDIKRSINEYLQMHVKMDDTQKKGKRDAALQERINLYNSAEDIVRFFMPPGVDSNTPTIGKFWKSLESLIRPYSSPCDNDVGKGKATEHNLEVAQNPAKQHNSKNKKKSKREQLILEMSNEFQKLLVVIQPFQELWSKVPSRERHAVTIPDKLVQAWLSLLLAVVLGRQNESPWRWFISTAHDLIKQGTGIIMQPREAIQNPFNKTVLQPRDLAALILSKLAQHVVQLNSSASPNPESQRQDIVRAYHQHLKRLRIDITEYPSPELGHKANLDSMKREVNTILKVIDDQNIAVSGILADRIGTDWSPVAEWSFGRSIQRRCLSYLEEQARKFKCLKLEVLILQEENLDQKEARVSRQENAVYAFTMVTIIFLPLGTVSSIFGMNTADIANMELGQWIYWVTAIPTTLIVILAGLWWMGELGNLAEWALKKLAQIRGKACMSICEDEGQNSDQSSEDSYFDA